MRKPEFITFTGADDYTHVGEMTALSGQYPIEWGILFSPRRQGIDMRYPGGEAQSRLLWSGLRLSAHLCGAYSKEIMSDGHLISHPPVDLGVFDRIQVNHGSPDPQKIIKFRKGWGAMRCIAQARADEFPADTSVDWLFDISGGRGTEPKAWPKYPGRLVGYAGGINPGNVAKVIAEIDATGPYWIDMESGVRTGDVFDLSLCRKVCEIVFGDAASTGAKHDGEK
jgi:hypothetical protein